MIHLTAVDASGGDSPVLVDETQIEVVTRTGDAGDTTTIYLESGITVQVKESVDEVEALIEEAKNDPAT